MALTLAHVSDLHFGLRTSLEDASARLVETLYHRAVDHVVISGDITNRGRAEEIERFWARWSPLREVTTLSVVPGNHDRLDDDVARSLMDDRRVITSHHEGLLLVRLDSTAPHNRRTIIAGHGMIDQDDLAQLDRALDEARPGQLVVVTMHHHPFPLPAETSLERLATWVGLPFAEELTQGQLLLERLRGRADLLLHGHRHVPAECELFAEQGRPLRVINAGCSPQLGRFRLLTHNGGQLVARPEWITSGGRRAAAPCRRRRARVFAATSAATSAVLSTAG
ncbi:MAG: metallophosphoesterase [Myxococcota bacterium]